jgi:hypothetical protein
MVVPGTASEPRSLPRAVRVLRHSRPTSKLVPFDLGADRYLRDGTTL